MKKSLEKINYIATVAKDKIVNFKITEFLTVFSVLILLSISIAHEYNLYTFNV